MKNIILISLILLSCNKEVQEPTSTQESLCDCYERHEVKKITLQGTTAIQYWELEYETEPVKDFCINDNGIYSYDQQGARRWTIKCN